LRRSFASISDPGLPVSADVVVLLCGQAATLAAGGGGQFPVRRCLVAHHTTNSQPRCIHRWACLAGRVDLLLAPILDEPWRI
jgi:hypothetical protein